MALVQREINITSYLNFNAGGILIQGNGTLNTTPNSSAITLGSGTNASGTNSLSLGNGTTSSGVNSVALGNNSSAAGSGCISIGNGTSTSGTQGTVLGISASTVGDNDFAAGSNAQCQGTGGSGSRIAIGVNTVAGAASQSFCICIGSASTATQTGGLALGRLASSTHTNSTALGINATTTAANQTVIAGSGNTQVLTNVGTTGLLESTGFVVSFNQVRASLVPSVTQTIGSGSGPTAVNFANVAYASDYGSPAIASVTSVLQTRANRVMQGTMNICFIFVGGNPAASGALTINVIKNTNGVINVMAVQTVIILSNVASYNICVNWSDYNQTAPAPNVFYAVNIDNPAAFARAIEIRTVPTHFNGYVTN